MKIGFIGLGKLGFPCATAMQMKGHDVMGYDIDPGVMNLAPKPYLETGPDGKEPFNPYVEKYPIDLGSMEKIAEHSEIIFVAVQTPHDEDYEGVTRLPDGRLDFQYKYLRECVSKLSTYIKRDTVVAIISTVLPGTFRRQVLPFCNSYMKMCYNPYFIAMGTTMRDFLNPEFIPLGTHDKEATKKIIEFYVTITDAPIYETSVPNAEAIKVLYNTFIGQKIVFTNTAMELCHKIPGCDIDEVMNGLKLGTERLISTKYMSGGMGDGGGCHPRDNIALSWLSQHLGLSYDWFEKVMEAREAQTEWLADLIEENQRLYDLPVVILGYSFKPETNLTVGSPALLLDHLLRERAITSEKFDPFVDSPKVLRQIWSKDNAGLEELIEVVDYYQKTPAIYFIGTRHDCFKTWEFPAGSVVIDPFRYIPETRDDVKYIHIGIGKWSTLFA